MKYTGEGEKETASIVSLDEQRFADHVGDSFIPNMKEKIKSGAEVVAVDPTYYRPSEVDLLIGNPGKARKKLGWVPKYDLKGLIEEMMESDINLMKKESYLREGGFKTLNYFE